MSIILTLLLSITWFHNIETAQVAAKQEDKNIIIIFSGSDWCRPCMKMNSQILTNEKFITKTADNFIFLKADFPQHSKKLTTEQKIINENLAEKYNKEGHFPYILIINKEGNVLKSKKGYKDESVDEMLNFILQ